MKCEMKTRKSIFLSLLVGFMILVLTGTAYAQEYYVSTNGNDGNVGTQTEPFKTIGHGAGELNAGDTLYIETGTYNYERIELRQSGTASNPINIIGIGNAIMLSDNHGHAFNLLGVEYLNFENIEIFHYSQGIYCVDVSHINIENCHIHYIGTSTISFKDADHCSIIDCDLSDTGWNNVQIMSSDRDTHDILIKNSKIHGCPGVSDFGSSHNGIDIFNSDTTGTHQIRDVQIIGNELYDMSGYNAAIFTHGYETKHMDNFIIADNEIYDTARAIVSFFRNLEFSNNNMYNNHKDGFRTLYPEKLIGPAHMSGNVIRDSNYDTRIVATGDGIIFENEDYQLLHIEGGSVIFKNPNRETVTIKETGSGKVTFQLTGGRDFTHNGKNQKTSIRDGYQLIIDGETVDITTTDYQPTPTPTQTATPDPTATSTPEPMAEYDTRLKQATPDTVLGSSSWLDVGRLGDNNYNSVLWFDLPNETVESATLSLFWYYESRDIDTEVELYRPAVWNPLYTTWNSYDDGLNWLSPGGDYFEKYDSITLTGSPDNEYHTFDVTGLVNSYIDGTYENTGFLIRANDNDGYVAFYSLDHYNADQRPKLTFESIPDPTPTPTETPTENPTATPDPTPDPFDCQSIVIMHSVILNHYDVTYDGLINDVEVQMAFSDNLNGKLSDIDMEIVGDAWKNNCHFVPVLPPVEHVRWDVNKDCVVDMLDLDIVASHYNETMN